MVEALNANNNETEVESRNCSLDHVGVMGTTTTRHDCWLNLGLWDVVSFCKKGGI